MLVLTRTIGSKINGKLHLLHMRISWILQHPKNGSLQFLNRHLNIFDRGVARCRLRWLESNVLGSTALICEGLNQKIVQNIRELQKGPHINKCLRKNIQAAWGACGLSSRGVRWLRFYRGSKTAETIMSTTR